MKEEIIKADTLNNCTWYRVKVDGSTVESYRSEESAKLKYEEVKKLHSQGLPKDTVILSETI